MAKVTITSSLKEFALIGALARIRELKAEIDRIKKQFGGRILGAAARVAGEPGVRPGPAARVADGRTTGPRKRRMSAAARKRISDAQKARWAKQRELASAAEPAPAALPAPAAKAKRGRPAGSRRVAMGGQKKR
jgi:hypothetical protein